MAHDLQLGTLQLLAAVGTRRQNRFESPSEPAP